MVWNGRWPDLTEYVPKLTACLLLFGVFDFFIARKTRGRYFAIHVLANAIVVCTTLPSIFLLITNPASAIQSSKHSTLAVCSNVAIHLYHMTMFSDLQWIDWLHHGLMTGIATPLIILYGHFFGPVTDGQIFFTCGLPGGIDYVLLFAMKHGWMHRLSEKKWNVCLNVWLRGPGIVMMCSMGYIQGFLNDPQASWLEWAVIPELAMLLLMLWNAQFFSARVVGNYAVRSHMAEQEMKQAGESSSSKSE